MLDIIKFTFYAVTFWFSPLLACLAYPNLFFINPHYWWAKFLQNIFGLKIVITSGQLDERESTYYLLNHSSQADFFIDQLVTRGRSLFISRQMVGNLAPLIVPVSWYTGSIFFFQRQKKFFDKKKLFSALESYYQQSPYPNILLYPEGTRNPDNTVLPLRKGFLNHIYEQKRRVQVIRCNGKEQVFSMKKRITNYGICCRVAYAEVIDSQEYATFEEFYDQITECWNATREKVTAQNKKNETLLSSEYYRPTFVAKEMMKYQLFEFMGVGLLLAALASVVMTCYGILPL